MPMNLFKDRTLLITGGTGSFGNAIVKRFLETDIKEIRIFSRDEKKQEDMRLAFKNERLKFYIGDIRDFESLEFATQGVDFVFHAAALKQVPSCEFFPMEAVRTNVIGTHNLVRASIVSGVQKVVALSTDKAVYPINAMGISKAMMEKIIVAEARKAEERQTILCCTRYGNVMASRGSVIPLFVSQIEQGKDVTVTEPHMTRFLMSLDDSVNLVLYAFQNSNPGDIFIQKAPSSTIEDLAFALIEIFNSSSAIKIIGTRHGEKLYETLVTREEMARVEEKGDFYRIPADTRDLNYNMYFVEGEDIISNVIDYTSHNTKRLSKNEVKRLLINLEYIQEKLNA